MTGSERSGQRRFVVDSRTEVMSPGDGSTVVLLGGTPARMMKLNGLAARIARQLIAGVLVELAAAEVHSSVQAVSQVADRLLRAGLIHPLIDASPAFNASEVTIVIPVKDRAPELARLLDALRAGPSGAELTIVVVDDASSEPTTAGVARDHGCAVVRHDQSLGPGAARNSGASSAATPLVAFIDSDCVPAPNWLGVLASHFDDPEVVAVAPRIVALHDAGTTDRRSARLLARYEAARSPLDMGPEPAVVAAKSWVSYVPTAALVVRRDVFERMGGFDEALHLGEDVDLVWRAGAHGVVRYEPFTSVAHEHRVVPSDFLRRRYLYGTSAARLGQRHPGNLAPVVASPRIAAVWALLFAPGWTTTAAGLVLAEHSARRFAAMPTLAETGAVGRRFGRRFVRHGVASAGLQLGRAATRAYLPPLLGLALVSRTVRRVLLLAAVVPNLVFWRRSRAPLDPIRFTALSVIDDAAYCTGVWSSCWTERSLEPLRPEIRRRRREGRQSKPIATHSTDSASM